jgi:hypothetical protein
MTDPRDRRDPDKQDPNAPERDNDQPPRPEEDPVDLPDPLTGPDVSLPV